MNNSNQKICYECNLTKHNEIEGLHSLFESADSILVPLLKLLEVKDLINSLRSPSCRTTVECPTKKELVTSILSEMLELYQEEQEMEEDRKNMLLEEMEFLQMLLTMVNSPPNIVVGEFFLLVPEVRQCNKHESRCQHCIFCYHRVRRKRSF